MEAMVGCRDRLATTSAWHARKARGRAEEHLSKPTQQAQGSRSQHEGGKVGLNPQQGLDGDGGRGRKWWCSWGLWCDFIIAFMTPLLLFFHLSC